MESGNRQVSVWTNKVLGDRRGLVDEDFSNEEKGSPPGTNKISLPRQGVTMTFTTLQTRILY